MAFVKCGLTQCDVYYCEILLGRLYVGLLYSINQDQHIPSFCPIEIVGGPPDDNIFFISKCQGDEKVQIFSTKYGYRPSPVQVLSDIPNEIENAADLTFRQFTF